MNPQELQELLKDLIQGARQLEQSGEELSDEEYGILARTLNNLLAKIEASGTQQSGVEGLPPNTGQVPSLDQGAYPSSNVNAYKYNPTNGELFVKFHGKDSANSGPTYRYENVPQNIYDVFSKGRVAPKTSGQNQYHRWIKGVTPSLGASLYALIRNGGFNYQRLS